MALAALVSIPFLFNNLVYFISESFFSENPWDWEPCRETVRNDNKSWDSRQNRESWQVCEQTKTWGGRLFVWQAGFRGTISVLSFKFNSRKELKSDFKSRFEVVAFQDHIEINIERSFRSRLDQFTEYAIIKLLFPVVWRQGAL